MAVPQPSVGDWYRLSGGELFEVVAVDDDDGTIEIQYFDGTVEEMDREDWEVQCEERALQPAGPPEDWSGSVDVEPEQDEAARSDPTEERDLRANPLDGLDIFEAL
jgi:DNA/RNA endonuclease YhcR with UshA esterase domain